MIISDEQARLAAQYLKSSGPSGHGVVHPEVSQELLGKVMAAVMQAPEARQDRVAEARLYLDAGEPDAHEVASKMISRIISDSLR